MTVTRGDVANGTGAPAIPGFSATQQNKRDVLDTIIYNYAANLKLLALLQQVSPDGGMPSLEKGRIGKATVKQVRYECYNFTDWSKTVEVTVKNSATSWDVNSTAELKQYDCLYYFDPSTGKTQNARIDSITDSDTIVITSFGTTTFDPPVGATLGISATAYPDNSVNPSMISRDFENLYNTIQTVREPVGISGRMKAIEFYGLTDWFAAAKKINLVRFWEKLERTFLFGDRAAGAVNYNSGGSTLTGDFSTTRGLLNWCANSIDLGGSITRLKLCSDVPKALSVGGDGDRYLALCSYDVWGRIDELVNDKLMYTVPMSEAPTRLNKFGVMTKVIQTSSVQLELVNCKYMSEGGLNNCIYAFKPENVTMVELNGRGVKPYANIEEPDRDGQIDEIRGDIGCRVDDGGQSQILIKNVF